MRPAVLTFWLLSIFALTQTRGDESEKVSNDQPSRPLQMPPASGATKEAFEDFERFQRRGAWERALKALYTIPDDQALRFVDGEDGFIVTVARKRRALLAALPPEGQAAYRLFYDAEAKRLFEEATGPSELKNLERLYSAYFPTSIGDNAADRLGDLYFEVGRFDRAADCWLAVLRECPDTDLSPALVAVKAAVALAHAGRRAELAQIQGELTGRYAGEEVTIAGQTATAAEMLHRLTEGEATSEAGKGPAGLPLDAPLALTDRVAAAWQVRIRDSIVAGMSPPELVQWDSNALSTAVPAVAIIEKTLFANYLGYDFALDLETGKMLWRSGSFHQVKMPAMQEMSRLIDPSRFTIAATAEYVWSVARDLKDQNYMSPFRLTCRRAEDGAVVWQSTDLPDYAQIDLAGLPLLAGGRLFIAGKSLMNPSQQRAQQQIVLAIRPHDGKILWNTEVGTFRQSQMYIYYGMREQEPQPQLIYKAGAILVDSHAGVLARLDAETGEVEWGYGYQTSPVQGQDRFLGGPYQLNEASAVSARPIESGESLIVKGAKSDRLCAIEPDRMGLAWSRPIAKSARLLGGDASTVFFGGPELGAIDLKTRRLLWTTRLPGGSLDGRVLVRPDGLWQLTPRGIFEIDPHTGDVRRIVRGEDTGAAGGDLFLTDDLLVAVSNRAISAYPRRVTGNKVSARIEKGATDE